MGAVLIGSLGAIYTDLQGDVAATDADFHALDTRLNDIALLLEGTTRIARDNTGEIEKLWDRTIRLERMDR
ncbi:MAG: hypothetical protein AAF092_10520 [Pseudomonadota bacterium]